MKNCILLFILFFSTFQIQAQYFTRISDTNPTGDGEPLSFTPFKGKLFFTAYDGTVNDPGIYHTDSAFTESHLLINNLLLYKIDGETEFIEFHDKLFFVADDGTHGYELWSTDGTLGGTAMVKDIATGINNSDINLRNIGSRNDGSVIFNNKLFFTANDGINGKELWISDGTETGTHMLIDINQGSGGISASYFTIYNNALYFFADYDPFGVELWKTDGTDSGTEFVFAVSSQQQTYYDMLVFNNKLWLTSKGLSQFQDEIYLSDGTWQGTIKLADSINGLSGRDQTFLVSYFQSESIIYDGKLLIAGYDTAFSLQPNYFLTDGTVSGTVQVLAGVEAYDFSVNDGKLFILDNNGDLYTTDNPSVNKDLLVSNVDGNLAKISNKLCFTSSDNLGNEPWVTDGTVNGTMRLVDTNPGSGDAIDGSSYWSTKIYRGKLYFITNNGSNNNKDMFWVTDGTPGGTHQIDLPASASSVNSDVNLAFAIIVDSCLFFEAQLDSAGYELWKFCDGVTNISEINEFTFKLFPNPTDNFINLQLHNSKTEVEFTIYNNMGQIVYQSIYSGSDIHSGVRVDIESLSGGLYTGILGSSENFWSERFVVIN